MDPTITAAIIAGVVTTLGVVVSILTSRWTIKLQQKEMDIKTKELETISKKITSDLEGVRQSQLYETIKKRTENYPKLWSVIREYTSGWDDTQPRDLIWVQKFLQSLNYVDTVGGVFFSQAVYEKFHELQLFLFRLKETLSSNSKKMVSLKDLETIDTIFRGRPGSPGMAAYLKDDLGNYRDLSIQARSDHETRIMLENQLHEITQIQETPENVFYKTYSCPPVGSEEAVDILALRQLLLNISGAVLLAPTTGMKAIEEILRKQPGFERTRKDLHNYLCKLPLKKPKRRITSTESLLVHGQIDSFHLVDLAMFIEDSFGVRLDDSELRCSSFDTLLELTAIVYTRGAEAKK